MVNRWKRVQLLVKELQHHVKHDMPDQRHHFKHDMPEPANLEKQHANNPKQETHSVSKLRNNRLSTQSLPPSFSVCSCVNLISHSTFIICFCLKTCFQRIVSVWQSFTQVGSGRSIPLRQGYLFKKSNKMMNRDWKKKCVTLCDDGKITYHPSLHDYMENVHGKEIPLQCVTVKVPGQAPGGARR